MAKTFVKTGRWHVAAAFAYLLWFVSGLVVYFALPRDALARFHAVQSILVGLALVVFGWAVGILAAVPIAGWLFALVVLPVFWLFSLVLWALLLWKAVNGERYALPVLGAYAERFSRA